jgi:hypothetical protein
VISLTARPAHASKKLARKSRSVFLFFAPALLSHLVFEKGFGYGGKRMLDAECRFPCCRCLGFSLDHGWVDPLCG